MNNNADALFKLLIPAVFLVLWALSQLYNREVAAGQKARTTGNPLGPRPGTWPPPMGPERKSTAAAPPRRPPQPAPAPPRRPRTPAEGVVLLDRGARGAPTAVFVDDLPATKRGGKAAARAARPAPSRRPDGEPSPRSMIAPSAAHEIPTAPLVTGDPSSNPDTRRTVSLDSVRRSLSSPERIREAILLQVILGQPAGLRRIQGRNP